MSKQPNYCLNDNDDNANNEKQKSWMVVMMMMMRVVVVSYITTIDKISVFTTRSNFMQLIHVYVTFSSTQ